MVKMILLVCDSAANQPGEQSRSGGFQSAGLKGAFAFCFKACYIEIVLIKI